MPEHKKVFLEAYLREIGVHTPISLLTLEKEKTKVRHVLTPVVANAAEMKSASASVIAPVAGFEAGRSCVPSSMDILEADAATCRLCGLAETRTQVVFGHGHDQAELLFIGEAPGQDEDVAGEPFVGSSGQLLNRMLQSIGLDRESVYVMNTIKCRPPNSRDPQTDEVEACVSWLAQQLTILQPKMICLLGRMAAQTLLQTDETLASLRGRWHEYQGIPVWVTYHPAYLLRSPRQKQKSWQDLMQLSQHFQAIKSDV